MPRGRRLLSLCCSVCVVLRWLCFVCIVCFVRSRLGSFGVVSVWFRLGRVDRFLLVFPVWRNVWGEDLVGAPLVLIALLASVEVSL